jgi:hypothetical protein
MATDLPQSPSDIELLHDYLGKQLAEPGRSLSLDEVLAGFQEYYRQLRLLRSRVQQAEDSLDRGEGRPLDVDSLIARVRKRLLEQGIAG